MKSENSDPETRLCEHTWRPVEATRAGFLKVLERLVEFAREVRYEPEAVLAQAALLAPQANDAPTFTLPFSRFNLFLEGRMSYSITRAGQRETVTLHPGQAIYWPPHSVTVEWWNEPCLFFGAVFYADQTRFLMGDFAGGTKPPGTTPLAYHTSHALEAPGVQLLASLDALCAPLEVAGWSQTDREGLAGPMLSLLLKMCQLQLQSDDRPGDIQGRSFRSWLRIQTYLQENYSRPVARDEVARSLGLHSSHITALCRRYTGSSFQGLLEELRLERARYLLCNTGFTIDRIAVACGYSTANYFIRVFRRATGATPTQFRNESR